MISGRDESTTVADGGGESATAETDDNDINATTTAKIKKLLLNLFNFIPSNFTLIFTYPVLEDIGDRTTLPYISINYQKFFR